jgi:hypothetical protein
MASAGRVRAAPAMFSRRWATDERAQAQVPDQALPPQFGECLELGGERVGNRRVFVDPGEGPQVDHVEPEPAEVAVHLLAQQLDRGRAVARGPKTPGPASCIAP